MIYKDIEAFLSTKRYEELLKKYNNTFHEVDNQRKILHESSENNYSCAKLMNNFASLYMKLKVPADIIEVYLKHEEATQKNLANMKAVQRGLDIKPTAIKDSVIESTKNIRRLSCIFRSYCDICDKLISAMQTQMNNKRDEYKFMNFE